MMNRKSITLFLLAFLLMGVSASAKRRTFAEARAIAEQQAAALGLTLSPSSVEAARKLNVPRVSGSPLAYYVFPNDAGRGFTIVSADDRLPDIVGYSDQGSYDPARLSDGYKAFLDLYAQLAEAVMQDDPAALETAAEAKAQRAAKASRAKVAPLLGDRKWSQTAPFNDLCPMDGYERSVTGCVATALAQVLAYWRFPEALKVDIPAYTTHAKGLAVPAIKAGEPYDWDNMLDRYDDYGYSQTEADAVAKLMLHCGAALQMDYSSSASSANLSTPRLAKYFGYDGESMMDLKREDFALSDWMNLLDDELAAKRPVLYSGRSSSVGHQFVCDGSDGSGLYHINWGWGGYQDGYFDITILNPDKGGTGSGTSDDGYAQQCSAIFGFQPGSGDAPVERWLVVSATTNATEGLYEMENSYIYDHQVQTPKTTDGDAIFTYGIQNNGETASLKYAFNMWGYPSQTYKSEQGTIEVDGNGGVAYVSTSVVPDDFGGDRTVSCILTGLIGDDYDYIPSTMDEWKLYILDPGMEGYAYRMNPCQLVVYIGGDTPSAIEQVGTTDPSRAYGAQGELVLVSDRSSLVPVYSVDGRKVCEVKAVSGSEVRVPLQPGVYIVNGRKVVVR